MLFECHIITGSPGVGKSYYGRRFAKEIKAIFLDIDTCSEKLVMAGLRALDHDPLDRDSQFFKDIYRDAIYETLFEIAKENLILHNVVIVGPFTKEIRQQNWLEELTEKFGQRPTLHYLYCEPHKRFKRVKNRNNPRDLSKLEDWESNSSYYGAEEPPACPHIYVDNSKDL